jgi:two-component system sensor histidine kinase QseC
LNSIRFNLIIVLLSIICLGNFVTALHGYRSSMAEANHLLNQELKDMAALLGTLAEHNDSMPADLFTKSKIYQVWSGNILLHKSANSPDTKLLPLEPGFHLSSYQGLRWQVLVSEDKEQAVNIVVGERADIYARVVEQIILESILPVIWVLPLLAVLIWIVVSLGLRPLERLAGLLKERRPDDLLPLKESGYPVELTVVIKSINQLLARLKNVLEREKRFATDAAHELRTPLATLKVTLHNLSQEIDSDNPNFLEMEASVYRIGHSIEQILALYRLMPENLQAELINLDLRKLTKAIIVESYDEFHNKQQKLELQAEPIEITGNEFGINIMLRNLVDNAGKYTPEGGNISLVISEQGDYASILVEDSGPGIPEEFQQRVFDRFYRVSGDRNTSDVTGTGLGLSIVELIVHLHKGQIKLCRSERLGGLCVEVLLPRKPDSPDSLTI